MHSFEEDMLPEELSILRRLTGLPLDMDAMSVVTNIYRAAQRMKVKMEGKVLSAYNLSWMGFTMLYNLWIWGTMEARELADSMGVTRATVSSIANTLERHQLVERNINLQDRRLIEISLTDKGKAIIEELYPQFNQGEIEITQGLSREEQQELVRLLRHVIKNMEV